MESFVVVPFEILAEVKGSWYGMHVCHNSNLKCTRSHSVGDYVCHNHIHSPNVVVLEETSSASVPAQANKQQTTLNTAVTGTANKPVSISMSV